MKTGNILFRLFLVFVISMGLGGCLTFHAPAKLTTRQSKVVANAGLSNLTVGIVAGKRLPPEALAGWKLQLERTGLFKKVDHLDHWDVEKPDLVMRINMTSPMHACMTGPGSVIIMTLGLMPVQVGHRGNVTLELMDADQVRSIPLAYEAEGSVWWGSAISVLALFPNWTLNRPDEARCNARLAYLIASRRDEILALATHDSH